MSRYIDVDRLNAEITDLCANANFYQQRAMEESNREDFIYSDGEIFAYAKVLSLIDSFQQEILKLSEKQLTAVEAAYSVLKSHDTWSEDEHLPILKSLINDLKKLF